jgi:hypothetical protein
MLTQSAAWSSLFLVCKSDPAMDKESPSWDCQYLETKISLGPLCTYIHTYIHRLLIGVGTALARKGKLTMCEMRSRHVLDSGLPQDG